MPDGSRAVSGSHDGTLRLWDLESGKEIATFTGEGQIYDFAIAPDGRTIIAVGELCGVHFLRLIEADETKSPMGDTKIQLLQHKDQARSATHS